MKSYKEFINEDIHFESLSDDIKELYIEFRDEWGFIETNLHNSGNNECTFRFKSDVLQSTFFIRMSFNVGSQDVDSCYNSLKEMCDRISSLESEIRVHHAKSLFTNNNIFLSVVIFPK